MKEISFKDKVRAIVKVLPDAALYHKDEVDYVDRITFEKFNFVKGKNRFGGLVWLLGAESKKRVYYRLRKRSMVIYEYWMVDEDGVLVEQGGGILNEVKLSIGFVSQSNLRCDGIYGFGNYHISDVRDWSDVDGLVENIMLKGDAKRLLV